MSPKKEILRIGLEKAAIVRVDKMGFTPNQKAFIFADWREGNEHYSWLLTATRDEIVAWGEASEWGREEKEA
jgi:hypothetical protein